MTEAWTVTMYDVALPLVAPFRTSLGVETHKRALVLALETPFGIGWSECAADPEPMYGPEFIDGARLLIGDVLLPLVARSGARSAQQARDAMAVIPGNSLARSAVELAVLDAEGRATGRSLAAMLDGGRSEIEVGVSLGIPNHLNELLSAVERYLGEGYRRIKLKVRPGWDVIPVEAVRREYGTELVLSVDANQGYSWERADNIAALRQLDDAGLLMIEQPFHRDDLVSHALLAEALSTSICLDESIESVHDARAAIALHACSIINIKPARVGGYLEAKDLHDVAVSHGIPVWCGGMLETGIGRHANIALASLPGFTIPGDISATSRYFDRDITPALAPVDGRLGVPDRAGIGVDVNHEDLHRVTLAVDTFTA